MTRISAIFILINIFSSLNFAGFCQNIRIDHVINTVDDLDSAIIAFEADGFTVKPGRLHQNGLYNAHIKFKDNTSFELMSVKGDQSDEMAKEYKDLLADGVGGAYLALSGPKRHDLEIILNELKVKYKSTIGEGWDYISFPNKSSLAHIFFIDYHFIVDDQDEVLTHKNLANGITTVWLEGDESVERLLNSIGLKPGGIVSDKILGEGRSYTNNSSQLIVVPIPDSSRRPRIKAALIRKKNNTDKIIFKFD